MYIQYCAKIIWTTLSIYFSPKQKTTPSQGTINVWRVFNGNGQFDDILLIVFIDAQYHNYRIYMSSV